MGIKRFSGNVFVLMPIIDSWIAECNTKKMGISLDEDVYLKDLQRLVDNADSDLLILENDETTIGFMGLMIFNSPLGRQKIANEHYYYVLPEHRGLSGLKFIRAAEQWAKEKECSHLIMNASCMASNLHDKVCKLYERLGFCHFETTYIKKMGE